MELTTKEHKDLRPYSYHIVEAIYTCHTWGVVRYGINKVYDTEGRALALEAGGAMHEVFAAIRLWQVSNLQGLPRHADFHGKRIFGRAVEGSTEVDLTRWDKLKEFILNCDKDEPRESLVSLAYETIHTSGYYDDDRDNIRTLTNMESASINYVDEMLEMMDQWPVYIEDKKKPESLIGIELTIDAVLTYSDGKRIRYIGTADAVLQCLLNSKRGAINLFVGENKTASRLDDGWRLAFEMSHQVTGYNVLVSTLLKLRVFKTKVFGLRLQPGRQDTYESFEPQVRTEDAIQKWAQWVHEGVSLYERYNGDFENARRITTACNRYFRPCALLPFCADSKEGREQQIEQMVAGDLSPSEQAVMLGLGV